MGIIQMTELQAMNLDIFKLVMRDTAAGEKAIAFIGGDQFKYELFKDAYAQAQTETAAVSRVDKAIKLTEEALAILQPAG
ncbi:DUF2560 family protein [Serratia fonticola]|uniref:DUF2560 family protein n=1 Tax=Serratia fonticola TaxID=47917 RepID=UPI001AE6C311|nr:DUF2560 family protein [Serratia fonticola]MBP1035874.1 DUF2560 family protein [Serratia fonticola]